MSKSALGKYARTIQVSLRFCFSRRYEYGKSPKYTGKVWFCHLHNTLNSKHLSTMCPITEKIVLLCRYGARVAQRTFNARVFGSNPNICTIPVSLTVKQAAYNCSLAGSTPPRETTCWCSTIRQCSALVMRQMRVQIPPSVPFQGNLVLCRYGVTVAPHPSKVVVAVQIRLLAPCLVAKW